MQLKPIWKSKGDRKIKLENKFINIVDFVVTLENHPKCNNNDNNLQFPRPKQAALLDNKHFWFNKKNSMEMDGRVVAKGKRKTANPEGHECEMTFSFTLFFLSAAVWDSGKTAFHFVSARPAVALPSIFKSLSADAIIETKQNKTGQIHR